MRLIYTVCWVIVVLSVSMLGCRVKQYPPELSAVSPKAAPIGQEITLSGFQFGDAPNVSFGQNGTFVAGKVTSATDQSINVIVPRMPIGATQVRVVNEEGTTDPVPFTVLQPAPILTTIAPVNGLPGATIVVTGDYLDRLKNVRFGIIPATLPTSSSVQSLTIQIPQNTQTGPQKLTIETEGGSVTGDFIVAGTPEITGFTPRRPRLGTEIIIQGKNLTTGVVRINGQPTDPAQTQVKDTEIRTMVPQTATSGKITVTTYDKLIATSADSVLIAYPPIIDPTGLSVTEGIQGDKVVLTGRNLRDVSEIKFGNTTATFRILSDTQVEVTVPAVPQSGETPIVVSGIGGSSTSQQSFVVILTPTTLTFNVTRQIRGKDLIIAGQNLHRITEIRINGRPATITGRTEGTEVRATVPADATSGPITVTNRAGSGTSAKSLIVVLPPTVTSFTRKAALNGRVIIQGDFLQDARVFFGSSTAAVPNDGRNTDDEIWVRVPADAQNGPVRVTNDAGEVTTPQSFTAIKLPSAITFTPASGSIGSAVTITGQNLLDVTEIRFGGGKSSAATFRVSGTSLIATVPANATDGAICLSNDAGTACSLTAFNVLLPPASIAFSPVAGTVLSSLTITGQNLNTVKEIRFGGGKSSPATFKLSGTSLIVTVPADATDGTICLTNDGGTTCSTTSYNVQLLPVGITFTPVTGKVGTDITLTGQNLSTVKSIRFGGGKSSAAAFKLSGNSLIVTVPADATDGPICLTGEGGTVCTGVDYKVN